MSFISILQKIGMIAGQAAPQIIGMVSGPLSSIATAVLNAVVMAESKFGAGHGDEKKQDAMGAVQVAIPVILDLVKATTGKELANEQLLSDGIGKLNDALVEILNAFQILPKPAAKA